jgi:hypothetical protein
MITDLVCCEGAGGEKPMRLFERMFPEALSVFVRFAYFVPEPSRQEELGRLHPASLVVADWQ